MVNDMMYVDGDAVIPTGNILNMHGVEWIEFRWVEGPKAGTIGVKMTDAARAAMIDRNRADYREQQAQFAKLHSK
jgi:hypothetical protein